MYFRSFGDDQLHFLFSFLPFQRTVIPYLSLGLLANLAEYSSFSILESVLGSRKLAILQLPTEAILFQ